jgi:MerR family copper efflux transcriptional regulator
MKISELATRTGVGPHALRHYERVGLLRAERRPNGYRDYDEAVTRDVAFIVQGRKMGFTLKQLREGLPAYRSGRLTIEYGLDALQRRIRDLDGQIAALAQQRQQLLSHVERLQHKQRNEQQRRTTSQAVPGVKVIWPSVSRSAELR